MVTIFIHINYLQCGSEVCCWLIFLDGVENLIHHEVRRIVINVLNVDGNVGRARFR